MVHAWGPSMELRPKCTPQLVADDKRALLEHLARQNVYTEQQGNTFISGFRSHHFS